MSIAVELKATLAEGSGRPSNPTRAGISIGDQFPPFLGDGLVAFHLWLKAVLAARMERIFLSAKNRQPLQSDQGTIMAKQNRCSATRSAKVKKENILERSYRG